MKKSLGLKSLGLIVLIGGFVLNRIGDYVDQENTRQIVNEELDKREKKNSEEAQ